MGWKTKLAKLVVSAFDLPLWLYFMYRLLQHVDAPEVLWFIFWLRIPLIVLLTFLVVLTEEDE